MGIKQTDSAFCTICADKKTPARTGGSEHDKTLYPTITYNNNLGVGKRMRVSRFHQAYLGYQNHGMNQERYRYGGLLTRGYSTAKSFNSRILEWDFSL